MPSGRQRTTLIRTILITRLALTYQMNKYKERPNHPIGSLTPLNMSQEAGLW